MRDQFLKVTDDSLQQDQRSRTLGDMIPARMQKLTIPHEEATTDVQIRFSVGDVSDGHHQSRSWSFGLNRDIEEASVADATKKKRNRRPTMRGEEYQLSTLDGRRKKLAARLLRKSTIINEMLLCKGNIFAVREELSELDDLFKIIEDTQREMIALDEAIYSDDQWFDELDEKTFAIKLKVYSWLKEAERGLDDAESRMSSSKKGSSRSSKSLSKGSSIRIKL